MAFTVPKRGPTQEKSIPKGAIILCFECGRHLFLAARDIECWDPVNEYTLEPMGNAKIPGPREDIVCSFCGADLFNDNGELLYIERLAQSDG